MKYLSLPIIICLFFSCARFTALEFSNHSIEKQISLESFTGTYDLMSNHRTDNTDNLLHLETEKANNNLHYALTEKIDTLEDPRITVDVKSFDERYLSFTFCLNKIQKEFIVKSGRLKKDGYFYLDDSTFECVGLPFILGGCFNSKTRLGIASDKGLILDKAISNKGAILFFLLSGESYHIKYHFKRKST